MWSLLLGLTVLFQPPPDVQKLIIELGNDSWKIREESHKKLEAKGWLVLPWLIVGRLSDDSEVRWRCDVIEKNIREVREKEFTRMFDGVYMPMIDCYWLGLPSLSKLDIAFSKAALRYVGTVDSSIPCGEFNDYKNIRCCTYLWFRDLYQKGCEPEVLWALYVYGWAREIQWYTHTASTRRLLLLKIMRYSRKK